MKTIELGLPEETTCGIKLAASSRLFVQKRFAFLA